MVVWTSIGGLARPTPGVLIGSLTLLIWVSGGGGVAERAREMFRRRSVRERRKSSAMTVGFSLRIVD